VQRVERKEMKRKYHFYHTIFKMLDDIYNLKDNKYIVLHIFSILRSTQKEGTEVNCKIEGSSSCNTKFRHERDTVHVHLHPIVLR
jgi:hypothetical protein